ncbi:hypothetical protein F7725_014614 [Dissostichus mawsoni]|uniref:Uncharacterized protein n=1 Tax=Dissostichus mawsoni TaxID=36200 RepID=A0A7J5YWX9_DISMA|nr:hypothetical protein F7725_014614 [Dissostichus mawsoni]
MAGSALAHNTALQQAQRGPRDCRLNINSADYTQVPLEVTKGVVARSSPLDLSCFGYNMESSITLVKSEVAVVMELRLSAEHINAVIAKTTAVDDCAAWIMDLMMSGLCQLLKINLSLWSASQAAIQSIGHKATMSAVHVGLCTELSSEKVKAAVTLWLSAISVTPVRGLLYTAEPLCPPAAAHRASAGAVMLRGPSTSDGQVPT